MRLKNTSNRNLDLLANYQAGKGEPFKVKVIAGSVLELEDDLYEKVKGPAALLIEAGVLEVLEAPASKLTATEIIDLVEKDSGIKLSAKMSKKELQEKALLLKVAV